jgi:UDP-glucose:(heptosyl)LPS alpha-1,3-glucosyltransferase
MSYSPYGGAETSIEQIRAALAVQDPSTELTVVTHSWVQPQAPDARGATNKQVIAHVPSRGLTRASRFRSFTREVDTYLSTHHFDVIQSHERISSCNIFRAGDGIHAAWLARMAKERGLPRGLLALDPYHRAVLAAEKKMAAPSGPIFVANSPLVASEAQGILQLPDDRIRLIPNMIDLARIPKQGSCDNQPAKRDLGLPGDEPCLLFVGSGFERKGAFKLVESLARLPDTQLLVIGKDKHSNKLQRLINDMGLAKRAHIIGPKKNLLPYWKAADVFCLPSLYDSFPNAALEAISHGTPCVLSDGVGIADQFV